MSPFFLLSLHGIHTVLYWLINAAGIKQPHSDIGCFLPLKIILCPVISHLPVVRYIAEARVSLIVGIELIWNGTVDVHNYR